MNRIRSLPIQGQGLATQSRDVPGGAGCVNGGDMMGDYGDKIWASPGASFGCAWDYGRARTIQQPVDTVQGIGRATFKVGDNQEFFAEFMGSKVTSKRQFEAQQLLVLASPKVVNRILEEESAAVAELEEFIGKTIRFQPEEHYAQEQYDVVLL